MIGCAECKKLSRRHFLSRTSKIAGGIAIAEPLLASVASTYAQSGGGTGNLLVLCELAGGLDALSLLAPFTSSVYQANRPSLALDASQVVALSDHPQYGINKQFQFFADLYQQGQVAIVQQVGYPDIDMSHFASQDIFKYGVRNLSGAGVSTPWYERLRKTYFDEPYGLLVTRQVGDPKQYGYPDWTYRKTSQAVFGRLAAMKHGATAMQEGILNAYRRIASSSVDFQSRTAGFAPSGSRRGEFYVASALAYAGLNTQIIKVRYDGFDTHANQTEGNASVFSLLNGDFQQFVTDMQAMGAWDRTCVVFHTEFGRRNIENSSGTDHGLGSHMVLVGPHVNGGLHGQAVTDADLGQGSLPYYVDFRAIFSSAIRDWLGFDPNPIFRLNGETFDENVGSSLFV